MLTKIDNILIEYDLKYGNNKKTIVFLHGWGGNLSNFSYFAGVFNNFGYTTLNINLTEHGFKNLKENFTIYDYSEVVVKLIYKLKLKNLILVGHSFGGRLAIIISSMYNVCDKIVLVDSAGLKPRFNLITKLKVLNYKINKKLVSLHLKNEKSLEKYGSTDYKCLKPNLKSVFKNVVNEDLTYLLKNIKIKALIVFGKFDKDTPLYMAKKLHKKLENSHFLVYNGGHYSYLDESSKFINDLKQFCKI